MIEKWKPITDYPGYFVSNFGKVKSTKFRLPRYLKSNTHRDGYIKVTLCRNNQPKTFQVHRLVAIAFLPNINNLKQVNHKDLNKKNNNVDNLEWMSGLDNMRHSYKSGSHKVGSSSFNAKLIETDIPNIRKMAKSMKLSDIAKMYGLNGGTIHDIVNRRTWKHVK